ncbi:trichome birefringence-like protein 3, partial [Tanacetum coccineum]
ADNVEISGPNVPNVFVQHYEKFLESWGRIGYARALIEVCADKELKQAVVMAIPKGEEVKDGHSVAKIRVEYEWKPPVCIDCKVFGHTTEQCPKKVVVQPSTAVVVDGDGFTTVVNRRCKGKGTVSWQKKNVGGFKVNNANKFVYQPVKPKENASKPSTSGSQKAGMESNKEEGTNGIKLKNLFEKLNDITYIVDPNSGEEERCGLNVSDATINQHNDDSESDIEEVFVEENPNSLKGESTPVTESHVDISLLSQVCSKVFKAWDWTSNANHCTKGCWIILGWNVDVVNVLVLSQMNQAMHVKIIHKASNKIMYCSFIYAGNKVSERRVLWSELGLHKQVVRGCPWILLGDFNVALNLKDSNSGSSLLNSAMLEFKDCVSNIEVMDINSSGLHFTWNQKPKGGGILRKLDRVANYVFQAFNEAVLDEEQFLKQKAKIEWLDVGDSNSAYFHKSHKSRNQSSRIEVILNADNVEISGPNVPNVFVQHYEKFLGTDMACDELNCDGLFHKQVNPPKLEPDHVLMLITIASL